MPGEKAFRLGERCAALWITADESWAILKSIESRKALSSNPRRPRAD
jgi:hypothetical protein